jgi:triacylglycerol lipase
MTASRLFLSPGFFGFSRVGSYDYFTHLRLGLERRMRAEGRTVTSHVVDVHPSASIRRRAGAMVRCIEANAEAGEHLHLVGHSTGGLDARLVASPTMNVSGHRVAPPFLSLVRSVTTINTPHYGTPLASFFATVSGQRVLAAVTAFTVAALTLGAPPLALTSSLVAAFGRIDRTLGVELRLIDGLVDRIVRLLDDASGDDLQDFLRQIQQDQGAIIQLSPEAMDLFQAGVEDNPSVRYQCTASFAPEPGLRHWSRAALSPIRSLSAPIFAMLHRLTSLEHAMYPCSPPDSSADEALSAKLGAVPPPRASDGVVPVRSQIWGELVWAGRADHLDVVGHFDDPTDTKGRHVDWLSSGSEFSRRQFDQMLDAIVRGLIAAEETRAS